MDLKAVAHLLCDNAEFYCDINRIKETSLTLSDFFGEVFCAVGAPGSKLSRSALIEQVLRRYFRERTRRKVQAS